MEAGNRGLKANLCAECFTKASNHCAKCKQRWYCSQYCQHKDWLLGHKGECGLHDLQLPSKVPAPPTRLIPEKVERPVIGEKQWSKLIEATKLGPHPEPPRGLRNLGNSCYMNSVLQGIFHGAPALLAACREHSARARCERPADGHLKPGEGCFRCDLEVMSRSCLDPRPPSSSSTATCKPCSTSNLVDDSIAWGDRVAIRRFNPEHLNGSEGIVEKLVADHGGVDIIVDNMRVAVPRENLELRCRAAAGPVEVARWLPRLGEDFTFGTQEDAHEYLRSLLRLVEHEELKEHTEALRKAAGEGAATALPVNADLTASPNRIFGGLLVSQCTCTNRACGVSSFSYEGFMDLSLDIVDATDSLDDMLRLFTAPEKLDKKNGWQCSTCLETVRARKQLKIYTAPDCLVLHLKRFRAMSQGKVTKPIAFASKLNLAPYLCAGAAESGRPLWYELRAVIVHVDKAGFTQFGHYVAFVRCSHENGTKNGAGSSWFLLDDSQVHEVSEEVVLRQEAYLLIYARSASSVEGTFQPASRRGSGGAFAGTSGGSREAAEATQEPTASKCRGLGGAVCSFFACSDGLCTKCYMEEHGRAPPAAVALEAPVCQPCTASATSTAGSGAAPKPTPKASAAAAAPSGKSKKVGANDPCPCGSGSKYKKCHGKK